MVRAFVAPALNQKTIVGIALLAAVIIVAFLLTHQAHKAAATNAGPVIQSLAAPVNTDANTSPEPSSAEDSLNSSPATNSDSSFSRNSLTVNGRDIPLPANGNVSQTTTDGNTTTTINAQTSNSSSGSQGSSSTSNNTSVNVQVNSHSENSR